MNRVTVTPESLRREIVDTLIICAVYFVSAIVGDGVAFRFIIGAGLVLALIEIFVSANNASKPKSNCIAIPIQVVVILLALVVLFGQRLHPSQYVLFIGVVTASDAFGLFCGRFFGRYRPFFSRNISPNKTYAGYIGELIGAAITGWLIIFLMEPPMAHANALYAWFGAIACAVGDLIGSAAKRELGIKHSSDRLLKRPILGKVESLIRSRHGYLDCLDSAAVALLFYSILISTTGRP